MTGGDGPFNNSGLCSPFPEDFYCVRDVAKAVLLIVNEPHPSSTTLQDIILGFRRAVGIVSLLCWYAKITDSSPRVYVRSCYGSGDSFPRSVFIISVIVLFQKYKFISQVKRVEGI